MAENSPNLSNIAVQNTHFGEVVSLNSWHDEISATRLRASLHVRATFGEGRYGEGPDYPVWFRLRLKQAKLAVIVTPRSGVIVDPASVSFDTPAKKAEETTTLSNDNSLSLNLKGSTGVSSIGASASAEASASAASNTASKKIATGSEQASLARVTQSQVAVNQAFWGPQSEIYGWDIRPLAHEKALDGQPWDPNNKTLLTLASPEKCPAETVATAVGVEVQCRREDLAIEQIDLKDKKLLRRLKAVWGFNNRMKAAEGVIRDLLMREGLPEADLRDKFSRVILARVYAQSRVPPT